VKEIPFFGKIRKLLESIHFGVTLSATSIGVSGRWGYTERDI